MIREAATPARRHTLHVALAADAYDVLIEPGLLDQAGSLVGALAPSRHLVLVTDTNVAATPHLARLQASLAATNLATTTLEVRPGEATKSFAALSDLCQRILELGIDRKTTLIACGGGVVGDLVGFAAAITLRGLPYVHIPTTLLAQVDSSVGGKTAIDTPQGKNLVGAFHQPRLVLVDPTTLDHLPGRQLRAGYAELVKHALIRDRALFEWLEEKVDRLLAPDPAGPAAGPPSSRRAPAELGGGGAPRPWHTLMAEAIARSVAIKIRIVEADPHEALGIRALLNFGHTFGHAYETLDGYSDRLLHGEAVAIGMTSAYRLSVRLGLCPGQDAERAIAHLRRAGLPTELADRGLDFADEALLAAMQKDKKVEGKELRFVVTESIGRATLGSFSPFP